MSIYVDDLVSWPKHVLKDRHRKAKEAVWCHMVSDGRIEELHAFARTIGVDKTRFIYGSAFNHYDLTPLKRAQAVQGGAIEVDFDMLLEIMRLAKQ